MKKKSLVLLLAGIIIALVGLMACAPADNHNVQKVAPITFIKTETLYGNHSSAYYVYKVKIEQTEYYLIKKEGNSDFKLIPIDKLNNTTETKDPYWNW